MKTLLFDMYGVILENYRGNFASFLKSRVPEADETLYRPNYNLASRGVMPYCDFMRLFGFDNAEEAGNDYTENFLTYDNSFADFAEYCKENDMNIFLLSNDISEWNKHIREYHDIDKYFDFCIISSDVGIRKPDEAIFRLTGEKLDCPPDECVYIDDNPDNLAVAARLGWQTVLFRRDGGYDGKTVKSFDELKKLLFI